MQHEEWPDIWRGEDEFIPKLNFQPEISSKINRGKEKSSLKPKAEAGLFLSEVDLRADQRLKIQLRDEFILTELSIWSLWMLHWLMDPGNITLRVKKIHWPPAGTGCSPDVYNTGHITPPFSPDVYIPIWAPSWNLEVPVQALQAEGRIYTNNCQFISGVYKQSWITNLDSC